MHQQTFTLVKEHFGHPVGTAVYKYNGCDYGMCQDDFDETGEIHIAVSVTADHCTPFFSIPSSSLK